MGDWIKIHQVGVVLNPRQERTQKMLALGLSMSQISRMTSTSPDVVEEDICTIHAAVPCPDDHDHMFCLPPNG